MSDENPFLVPLKPHADAGGRSLEAGRGIAWLREGWQMFVARPGVWIAVGVVFVVVLALLNVVPVIGGIAGAILTPVLGGGVMLGCRDQAQGGELRFERLFAGFSSHTQPLVMVGVYCMLASVAIALLVFALVGGSAMSGAMMGHGMGAGMAAGGFLLGMLLLAALSVPLVMAAWFAPALVVFRDEAPLDALKHSFAACLRNMGPFLLYGLLALVGLFLAMLPFGLGLVVFVPVTLASVYRGYVDIFE